MKDNPMQWSQTTPTISRLDYIATAIYAAYIANPAVDNRSGDYDEIVSEAKGLIAVLDKEQQQ